MACELRAKCPLFNDQMEADSTTRAMYRVQYCNGEYSECARYLVFTALGAEHVPRDLYPNDRLRALGLVRASHTARDHAQDT